jgi:uncharacterized membrane protein YphA (DoxX/SURF4 family)
LSKFEKAQPWIGLLARLVLGGVLFAAGYLKIDKLDISQMAVRSYELLPISIANFLGMFLPFFEIAVGLLLILGAATRIVAALGGFTMFIFIIAISQAWAGLVALALFLLRYPATKFSVDKHQSKTGLGEME